MIVKINSCTPYGLDCLPIDVEVDVTSQGLPSFNIVGLPNKAVEEAKERVRSALVNSGFSFPTHHITVNLAPADFPKEGAGFDLAIAVGILAASGQLDQDLSTSLFVGELSLDGTLRTTQGILSVCMFASSKNYQYFYLPVINAKEAGIIPYDGIMPVISLKHLYNHFLRYDNIIPYKNTVCDSSQSKTYEYDLKDIRGQEQAKRALEICAAGGHNLMFKGPPGAGKTLLARTLPSILPAMTLEEQLELTRIYSHTGLLKSENPLINQRPFRAPHHTVSHIGLIGGGPYPKPGEISLAHRGVLFLDEMAEFPRICLEVLRQPLEDGFVAISRVRGTLTFPAKFILISAVNPCPCGYFGQVGKQTCRCRPGEISKYQKKISGPLLDRIDLYVEVPPVEIGKLTSQEYQCEDSQTVRQRVQRARDIQRERFREENIYSNGEMKNKHLKKYIKLDNESLTLLKKAIQFYGLSARSYQKIIKIGRTIADLAKEEEINKEHLGEALQYRQKIGNDS